MWRGTLAALLRSVIGLSAIGLVAPAMADGESRLPAGAVTAVPEKSAVDVERSQLIGVIQDWVAAVNREEGAAVTRLWVPDSTVIDSFPPYVWQGPKAIAAWWSDYESLTKAQGLADIVFRFEPRHVDVVGDRAYVVGDGRVDYRIATGQLRDRATWMFCLARIDGAWRFTAWAWGHLDRGPVPQSP